MKATVSEIHSYPLRPQGYEEPLFLRKAHRKEIAEHLACSSWLMRASEAPDKDPEPCHLYRDGDGVVWLARAGCYRRKRRAVRHRVLRVVERWREVSGWWESGKGSDRICFRVVLCGGAVVEVALERTEGFRLLRVLD